MLHAAGRSPLTAHLGRVRQRHQRDGAPSLGKVDGPNARPRQSPHAHRAWGCRWVFPAAPIGLNPRSGDPGRHHLHASARQRAANKAARKRGLTQPANGYTRRHACAPPLREDGDDLRTRQEPFGHRDVSTTMIYIHGLNQGGKRLYRPIARC